MKDYREKIRKLLALAESPNENEAKAALLKARELMAEYKLTEADCTETKSRKAVNLVTEWTSSKRRDAWLIQLSAVIGEHYCCKAVQTHKKGSQTYAAGFIGLEEDAELCVEIFDYAVRSVYDQIEKLRQEMKAEHWHTEEGIRLKLKSYGFGFVRGLQKAFDKQTDEAPKEWGLILTIPQEVLDKIRGMDHMDTRFKAEKEISREAYAKGFTAGQNFDPTHVLKEGKKEQSPALCG